MTNSVSLKRNIIEYTRTKIPGLIKKGYQIHALVIKKDGVTAADTTGILSRWEKFYINLLNVNQSSNLERIEINIPEPSLLDVEFAIENGRTILE